MKTEDQEKTIKFLANQLLGEVTFSQVLDIVKYQAVQQAKGVFKKMTDKEQESILENLQKTELETNE